MTILLFLVMVSALPVPTAFAHNVPSAAPFTPHLNTNINIGSNIVFNIL